jgi:hypothetical protein
MIMLVGVLLRDCDDRAFIHYFFGTCHDSAGKATSLMPTNSQKQVHYCYSRILISLLLSLHHLSDVGFLERERDALDT